MKQAHLITIDVPGTIVREAVVKEEHLWKAAFNLWDDVRNRRGSSSVLLQDTIKEEINGTSTFI